MNTSNKLPPAVQDILRAVADEFDVTTGFALQAGRMQPAPTIRRIVWLYLERCLQWDRVRIAVDFNVSRSAVVHGLIKLRQDGLFDRWCAWLDNWQREHSKHQPPCCLPPEGGQG